MKLKPLSRRTFLRGSSAAIALPFLEAMLPVNAFAQANVPLRFMPMLWEYGTIQDSLIPSGNGTNYSFANTPYAPLEGFRNSIIPVRNLFNHWGDVDGAGHHARGHGTYLTAVRINKSEDNIRNSISADQVIANAIGNQTRFASLYMGHSSALSGGDSGYGPIYKNLSWLNATQPSPYLASPQQIFDLVFANNNNPVSQNDVERQKRLRLRKSILDEVVDDTNRLIQKVSSADKAKLDQYLTSVREVEVRVAREIAGGPNGPACPQTQRPSNGSNYDQTIRTILDLAVLAFQCDATRVIPFMFGSAVEYGNIIGVGGTHHDLSHHGNNQNNMDSIRAINRYYATVFAEFLQKMNNTTDVNGQSLLNNSIITFGPDMHDGDRHNGEDLPFLVAGNAGGKMTPGRIVNEGARPISNVWVTIMQHMGVNRNSFGEGQGAANGTLSL